MVKTILFDLDGTLLPMDQDIFVETYLGELAKKMAPHGYNPNQMLKGMWAGVDAMVKNNGSCLNEECFWKKFCDIMGEQALEDTPIFDEFYRNEFQSVRKVCGYNPKSVEIVKKLQQKGLQIILATNPLFPSVATESRMRWAGLSPEDFDFYTTYDNSHYCKPNPMYYQEILEKIERKPNECLMVGNDVNEDMIAETLGMNVFLLTDCLINKDKKDISGYPQGNLDSLIKYLDI